MRTKLDSIRPQLPVGADRLLDRLERIASRDSLTGAASRRAFFELAGARFELARNRRKSLAVIVIDVDRFKSVNDEFGHAGGDLALQGIANALCEGLREQDLLGRLGGEEFAALLPDADLALASQVAERLRRADTIEARFGTLGLPARKWLRLIRPYLAIPA